MMLRWRYCNCCCCWVTLSLVTVVLTMRCLLLLMIHCWSPLLLYDRYCAWASQHRSIRWRKSGDGEWWRAIRWAYSRYSLMEYCWLTSCWSVIVPDDVVVDTSLLYCCSSVDAHLAVFLLLLWLLAVYLQSVVSVTCDVVFDTVTHCGIIICILLLLMTEHSFLLLFCRYYCRYSGVIMWWPSMSTWWRSLSAAIASVTVTDDIPVQLLIVTLWYHSVACWYLLFTVPSSLWYLDVVIVGGDG